MSSTTNFVEELRWRGLIHNEMPNTEQFLLQAPSAGYIGFDPTADSLHVGSLQPVILLMQLQRAGHKPIALVGGATGMIGDPSGKSEERVLLQRDVLEHNVHGLREQLSKFLDFDTQTNPAQLVNNYDWFKDISLLDFLRDTAKHISVNYMMAKDSVQKRLETGISFTEFSYQLIQGYDYLHLYRHHGCRLQMGASDQWGNIVTGTELIRRVEGGEAYALTCPLLTKADGSKFGKSEGGNVWLDPKKTSPFKFYQFFLNLPDDQAIQLLYKYTLWTKEHIESIIAEHQAAPHKRIAQQNLGAFVTTLTHSEADYQSALRSSGILFGNPTIDDLLSLSEATFLEVFDGVPSFQVSKFIIEQSPSVLDLVSVHATIFPSKGEARKMITGGGVAINYSKVLSPDDSISTAQLLHGRYLLVQKGKKNFFIIEAL